MSMTAKLLATSSGQRGEAVHGLCLPLHPKLKLLDSRSVTDM